jgi:hypothetical protein
MKLWTFCTIRAETLDNILVLALAINRLEISSN